MRLNRKRSWIIIFFIFTLLGVTPLYAWEYLTSDSALKSGPGQGSTIMPLPKGSLVYPLDTEQGGWQHVRIPGAKTGWIYKKNLSTSRPSGDFQIGFVRVLAGKVFIKDKRGWRQISTSFEPIFNYSKVVTTFGRVQIRFEDSSYVNLDVSTYIGIIVTQKEMTFNLPTGKTFTKKFWQRRIELVSGDLWFDIKPSEDIQTMFITPCNITLVRGYEDQLMSMGAEGRLTYSLPESENKSILVPDIKMEKEKTALPTRKIDLQGECLLSMLFNAAEFCLTEKMDIKNLNGKRAKKLYEYALLPIEERKKLPSTQFKMVERFHRIVGNCLTIGNPKNYFESAKVCIEDITLKSLIETEERVPGTAVVLCIDRGNGMNMEKLNILREKLKKFWNLKEEEDQGAVIQFTREIDVIQPFTRDVNACKKALLSIKLASGNSDIIPVLSRAIDMVIKTKQEIKAVLIVTPGIKRIERGEFSKLIRKAQDNQVLVFIVDYGTGTPDRLAESLKEELENSVGELIQVMGADELKNAIVRIAHYVFKTEVLFLFPYMR